MTTATQESPAVSAAELAALFTEGLAELSRQNAGRAVELLAAVVTGDPGPAEHWLHFGDACLMVGDIAHARASFSAALERAPASGEPRYRLALAAVAERDWRQAVLFCREALRCVLEGEEAVRVLSLMAFCLGQLGRWVESAACSRQLLALEPGYVPALIGLGAALREQGDLEGAQARLERALAIEPNNALALVEKGLCLAAGGALDRAEACYREALERDPDSFEAWLNLSGALAATGRGPEAGQAALEALRRRIDDARAHAQFATALQMQGDVRSSVLCLRRAVELEPEDAELHTRYALALLATGDWAAGWEEYGWRIPAGVTKPRPTSRPEWDGDPASTRKLLVWAEQSEGDTIQFLRYLPQLRERGVEFVLEVQHPLANLLRRVRLLDGIEVHEAGKAPADFDHHIPLLSLPRVLGARPENIPVGRGPGGGYLEAPPEKAALWSQRVARFRGLKVGLAWDGDVPAPLLGIEGVTYFSLSPQTRAMNPGQVKAILPAGGDLADMAGLIANLDLVISVDATPAHLAGALGRPVWLVLPATPEWRWGQQGGETCWYPSMRLFRQQEAGGWSGVVARIEAALRGSTG